MKRIIVGFICAFALHSYADTHDSKTFTVDGSKTEDSFVLKAEKNHTEYRDEVVNKTCYRDEFIGYRQQCDYIYERVCHPEQECRIIHGRQECYIRNVCTTVPRYHCYQVPEYRTVPYACQEVIKVPYTVKDYDVQATVRVAYGPFPQGLQMNEPLKLNLEGDKVSLQAQSAQSNVVIFMEQQNNDHLAGNLKTIEVVYTLNFIPLKSVSVPLSADPKNFVLTNNEILTWDTRLVENPDLFKVNIVIKKTKFLSGSEVVVDKIVSASDLQMSSAGSMTRFLVTLTDLGFPIEERKSGTYKVSASLMAAFDPSKVLNASSLPKMLQVKGEGKIKLK